MKATNETKPFELPPEDIYPAVCIGVYDLGLQKTPWGNKQQVYLQWELDHVKEDGKRFTIGQTYTLSLFDRAPFRIHVENWRGKKFTEAQVKEGFDPLKLLGQACQIQVVHKESKGKTYANVGSIVKLSKEQKPLKPSITPISFDFERDGRTIPVGTPKWATNWIQGSINWTHSGESALDAQRRRAENDGEDANFQESDEVDSSIPF